MIGELASRSIVDWLQTKSFSILTSVPDGVNWHIYSGIDIPQTVDMVSEPSVFELPAIVVYCDESDNALQSNVPVWNVPVNIEMHTNVDDVNQETHILAAQEVVCMVNLNTFHNDISSEARGFTAFSTIQTGLSTVPEDRKMITRLKLNLTGCVGYIP